MSCFIELVDVSKVYGNGESAVRAVDGISFTAERGEWIAIMGPSGSGKTTLLNLLGCLDQATSGAVRIDGTDTSQLRRSELARFRSETVGFVFQQFHLVPHLTAVENVMLAQFFHSMTDEAEAMRALEQVGMAARASHLPSQLSGGEQQRVAIARALAMRPEVLLLDEPTSALDPIMAAEVMSVISELARAGQTMIVVTHQLGLVRAIADTVHVFAEGRRVEHGPTLAVFENPAHETTRAFLRKLQAW
jgi:putative ABC transport system ATP-binding protein